MDIMNIPKNNIVHNFLVIFRNIFVFTNTYMLAMTINEKDAIILQEERRVYMGRFGRRKRKGEL